MSKASKATIRAIADGSNIVFKSRGDDAKTLETVSLKDMPVGRANDMGWFFIGRSVQGFVSRSFGSLSPEKALEAGKAVIAGFLAGNLPEIKRGRTPDFVLIYARSKSVDIAAAEAMLSEKAAKYGDAYDQWCKGVQKHPRYLEAQAALLAERAAEAETAIADDEY